MQQVRPDGLIFDSAERQIHILEIARTSDNEDALRNRFIGKSIKYQELVEALRDCFPMYQVTQHTFVIGKQGSIHEATWRRQLAQLGMSESRQSRLIQDCIEASIEGMQSVLRARPMPATGDGRQETGGSGVCGKRRKRG